MSLGRFWAVQTTVAHAFLLRTCYNLCPAVGRVCVNPSSTGNGSLHVVMQIGRGTELSDATLSNEAMHQRGKHPLATDVYLPKIVWTVDQAVTLPCFAESFADHSFADNPLFIVHVYFAERGFVFRRTSWYYHFWIFLPFDDYSRHHGLFGLHPFRWRFISYFLGFLFGLHVRGFRSQREPACRCCEFSVHMFMHFFRNLTLHMILDHFVMVMIKILFILVNFVRTVH